MQDVEVEVEVEVDRKRGSWVLRYEAVVEEDHKGRILGDEICKTKHNRKTKNENMKLALGMGMYIYDKLCNVFSVLVIIRSRSSLDDTCTW